jgi:hypothetical protein
MGQTSHSDDAMCQVNATSEIRIGEVVCVCAGEREREGRETNGSRKAELLGKVGNCNARGVTMTGTCIAAPPQQTSCTTVPRRRHIKGADG